MAQDNRAIQTFRTNSDVPSVASAHSLADIRLDVQRFPHYSTVPKPIRVEWLALEIIKYMKLSHMKPADTTVDATALDEMMMEDRYMADLTQPEIDLAFRNGVFGKYGDFYGLTAMSLYGFLNSFLDSELKRESAREVRSRLEKQRAARELKEKEAERARIRAEIEKAKKDGTFTPVGGAWWRDGEKPGPADSERHRALVEAQAREMLRKSGAGA